MHLIAEFPRYRIDTAKVATADGKIEYKTIIFNKDRKRVEATYTHILEESARKFHERCVKEAENI